MQDVLLLAAVAAIFAFGWFLMGKLDRFLEANCPARTPQFPSGENTLRLGFCDSAAAGSIADVLEQYSRLYPDISVRIFCGSEEELLEGFSTGRFDVVFLQDGTTRKIEITDTT